MGRYARAIVISARPRHLSVPMAPASEVSASKQLYQKWALCFVNGFQPAQFSSDNPIWVAVGVPSAGVKGKHAPANMSTSVTLSPHAAYDVVLRYLRDNYAATSRLVRVLGDSVEALSLLLRLLGPGLVSRNIDVASWTCRMLR